MSKLKQIIRLRNKGLSLSATSEATGLARNTVKKYLRLIEVKGLNQEELLEMDDAILDALLSDPARQDKTRAESLELMFPYIEKELRRTGVNRWVLWGEYKALHPDGYSYSQFCDHYNRWKQTESGSFHQQYQPGEKLFIDYTGKKLSIVDAHTGEVTPVDVFAGILGFSQLTYVEAVASQKNEDLIRGTENTFYFLGGVPKAVVPDNLKSAVTVAEKHEPQINATFLDFANHYKTCVLPARSRKPRDKAHVEKIISVIYSRIFAPLRNQIFYSLSSLNQAIRELLDVHNNQPFQGREESRLQLFEQHERQALLPLPEERYETRVFKEVTVMKNGYVQISEDKHSYSVPYRFIGRKVKLIYSLTKVSVFYQKERIAYHRRLRKYGYSTIPEHLSSTNKFVSEWNPDRFINWAGAIAPVIRDFIIKILEGAPHPEQAYRSCVGILSFEKKFGKERLVRAVERATYFSAFNYTMVKKILHTGMDQIAFGDDIAAQVTLPFHENIRGPEDYQ